MKHPEDDSPQLRKPDLGGECIMCGKCQEVCPLFLATGREELTPRAKAMLVSALETDASTLNHADAARLAGLCLSCGGCARACPQGLRVMPALAALKSRHSGFREWLWKSWISNAGLLWPFMRHLSGLLPGPAPDAQGLTAEITKRAQALSGRSGLSGLPVSLSPEPDERDSRTCLDGPEILIFPGCGARYLSPWRIAAAERLLRAAGGRTPPRPDFACCGFTLGQAGQFAAQTRARSANLRLWREAGRPRLTTFCATCLAGLRAYAESPELFEPGEDRLWLEALTGLDELVHRSGLRLRAEWGDCTGRIFLHRPCHATGWEALTALLRPALGERLAGTSASCCGLGGVLQVAAPGLSARVAARTWAELPVQPGDLVATACSGCAIQLAATAPTGVGVGHWLDLIRAD